VWGAKNIKKIHKNLDMSPQNRVSSVSMKYQTLQKVTLTTVAVLASLALSAQARTNTVRSARQANGSPQHSMSFHGMLFPASTYMLDDGTAENAVGLTLGGDIICLNEFAVIPGSETITTVSIAWGTPAFPDPSLDGLPYTVALWSDPNGDGEPSDAVLLTTAAGVVSMQGTDTFLTTDISDTTITTPNFFVGFLIHHQAGQFPAAFDESNPLFNRSFVAGDSVMGNIEDLTDNELPVAPIEFFGLFGNWLIRADATGGGGEEITLTAKLRRVHGIRKVALSWTPADGGRINIFRDGVLIDEVNDDGRDQDRVGARESHTYQVCETDTGTCSNEVTIQTPGGPQ
jgi:hypothetical protein